MSEDHLFPPVALGWRLALAAVLIAINAFFVAAEFALVRVRATRLEELGRRGDLRAKVAVAITLRMDSYLSACQLGVTAASLGLGWVGEPAMAELIGPALRPLLGFMDSPGHASVTARVVAFAVGFSLITFIHIVVGEQAPKILAIQRSEATLLGSSLPLRAVHAVAFPFIWVLNEASNALCRAMGVDPHSHAAEAHSGEELKLILSASHQQGTIAATARDVVTRALDMSHRTVKEVMVGRNEVAFLDVRRSSRQNLAVALESGFTRYPLCDGGLDHVVGMVHLRDLMVKRYLSRPPDARVSVPPLEGTDRDLRELARPTRYVPEQMKLSKAMRDFQRTRTHQAVVVDEYGSVVGLVTLEDVLEALVGPIQDEFDEETPLFSPLDKGEVRVDGSAPIAEVNTRLGTTIQDPQNATVGGHVTTLLGRIAQVGDRVRVGNHDVVVEKMSRLVVDQVRFVPRPPGDAAPDGAAPSPRGEP
jgi:CBS domain containing-hemolysin-like protein